MVTARRLPSQRADGAWPAAALNVFGDTRCRRPSSAQEDEERESLGNGPDPAAMLPTSYTFQLLPASNLQNEIIAALANRRYDSRPERGVKQAEDVCEGGGGADFGRPRDSGGLERRIQHSSGRAKPTRALRPLQREPSRTMGIETFERFVAQRPKESPRAVSPLHQEHSGSRGVNCSPAV
jgi:hypothetical protein